MSQQRIEGDCVVCGKPSETFTKVDGVKVVVCKECYLDKEKWEEWKKLHLTASK